MADTKIQWCDKVWNPVRGCSIVSAGCSNCYAMKQARRFSGPGQPYEGLTRLAERGPIWTGKIRLVPEALDEPLRWRKPQRVFVNSMSDLFHEDVPDKFIDAAFGIMALAERHTFQVLTKRPERMAKWFERVADHCSAIQNCYQQQNLPPRPNGHWFASEVIGRAEELLGRDLTHDGCEQNLDIRWPLPNVHLGVSVEDQATADERIPILLQTPAALRFLSVEPLLSAIDFGDCFDRYEDKPDWLIVGGESGQAARPCNIEWIRSIVAQCKAAGVACFVKQLGSSPYSTFRDEYQSGPIRWNLRDSHGGDPSEWPEDLRVREFPNG